MFATLGRFINSLDGGAPELEDENRYGFQVLRNTDPSVPLEPWFDFLIQVAGRDLTETDADAVASEFRNCAGGSIHVTVWNAKVGEIAATIHGLQPGRERRSIYIPVRADSSLGLVLQWEKLSTTDFVWHVVDVTPGSPADKAGMIPHSDYVIDSPDGLLRNQSALEDLIDDFMNRNLRLHVYNREYDVVRPVTVTPSLSWGGQGRLGCSLAFGALHRLPQPLEEPPQAPGETLYDTAVIAPPPPPPPPQSSSSSFQNSTLTTQPHGTDYGPANTSSAPKPDSRSGASTPGVAASVLVAGQPHRPRRTRHAPQQATGTATTTTTSSTASSMVDAYLAAATQKGLQMDDIRVSSTSPVPPPPSKTAPGPPPPPPPPPPKSVTPVPQPETTAAGSPPLKTEPSSEPQSEPPSE